jgi:Arc/MetJ-type ribon-helix-helix transcriptional regulator
MKSSTFTVRLKGDVLDLVNGLVSRGYSESKTEAIRTSLAFYGMHLGLIGREKLKTKAGGKSKKSIKSNK